MMSRTGAGEESKRKSQTSIPRIMPLVSSCYGDEFDKNTDGDSHNESALQGEHTHELQTAGTGIGKDE